MQRYRIVILIVLFGILPVATAFVFAFVFLDREAPEARPAPAVAVAPSAETPPADPAPEKPRVLAAIGTLPVGSLLRVDDLAGVDLDLDLDPAVVKREYVTVGEDQDDGEAAARSLRGYAVRETIGAGDPLTRRAVVGPGQPGFLATVLRPGTRAVAIEVGPATSQAGLIDPGDRVDVILTAELPAAGPGEAGFAQGAPGEGLPRPAAGGAPGEVLARTIVENARVVAIDRTTRGIGGPPRYGEEEEVSRGGITTATLEVLPGEDDRLVLGGRVGRLSLVTRSLRDNPPRASTAAVKLRELLRPLPDSGPVRLPPEGPTFDDMTALEDRLLTEFGSLEENLRAAMAAEGEVREPLQELQVVRIFRGSAPAERVCFQAGKGLPCPDSTNPYGAPEGGAAPGPLPSAEIPPIPSPELPTIPSPELPTIPSLELPPLDPGRDPG